MSDYKPTTPINAPPVSVTIWDRTNIALFATTIIIGLGLVIFDLAGGDVGAWAIAAVVSPLAGWFARLAQQRMRQQQQFANQMALTQQSARLEERAEQQRHDLKLQRQLEEHEKAMGRAMQAQQWQFQYGLTVGKRAEVFEQVLSMLHDYALVEQPNNPSHRAARVRQISEAVYKVLVYFHDRELIEMIVRAFESSFAGKQRELLGMVNGITLRFQQRLMSAANLEMIAMDGTATAATKPATTALAADFDHMGQYLNRLNKAMIGLGPDAGVVPIKISMKSSPTSWLDLRFGHTVTKKTLSDAMGAVSANLLQSIQAGDLLVFWRDPRYDANDGVIGVVWVHSVDRPTTGEMTLTLGRRITVPRNNVVRFRLFDEQQLILQPTDESDADTDTETLTGADDGQGTTGDAVPAGAPTTDHTSEATGAATFESLIRYGERIAASAITYPMGFVLSVMLDQLEATRAAFPDRAQFSVAGRLKNLRVSDKTIRLLLDFNAFDNNPLAERFLEELVSRHCSGKPVEVHFDNQAWQITSMIPRTMLAKGDPFRESLPKGVTPTEIDRSFTLVNLSPVQPDAAKKRESGWSPMVDVRVAMDDGVLSMTIAEKA